MNRLQQMLSEFYQLAQPVPEFMSHLRWHRFDLATLPSEIGIFGVALCRRFEWPDGSAGFEFSLHGVPCAVIEAICYRQDVGLIEPYTADLVAWPVNDPHSFATALGPCDGAELLGPLAAVKRGGQPLHMFQSPFAWMQNNCGGSVLLKPGAEFWLHKAGGPFVAEDFRHAIKLRELLGGKHQILVPSNSTRTTERRAA